ncbi:MAG TPA: peptidylprolyl isomerase [Gemmatimonadaceae bacterium]|nr:peptidylprolyl isomerase [Gemmatimonadaceae bacterium]
MKRPILACASVLCVLTACQGFKDAMTSHTNVVARAGARELTADHLANLMSQAKMPTDPSIAKRVAGLWVDYQLAGQAAARGDSLSDPQLVDRALWPAITQQRLLQFHDTIMQRHGVGDSANYAARYAAGDVLAASHILFAVPSDATTAVRDSIRRVAESVRKRTTPANFGAMARKYSKDPGSAARGGSLGVFRRGAMVPEFEKAVLALKPGEISPLVQTKYGYHIIERLPYDSVKVQVSAALKGEQGQAIDSSYFAQLDSAGHITLADGAAATLKSDASDLDSHRDDKTVLATSTAGDFTVGRFVQWLDLYPQQQMIEQQLGHVPDNVVNNFIRGVVRNDLFLHQADSAKVKLDSSQLATLHAGFAHQVASTWAALDVAPSSLADSASTTGGREQLAAARVDDYFDKLVTNKTRFVPVQGSLESVLRAKYDWEVNEAGVNKAIARAKAITATADSARKSTEPPTTVPLTPGSTAPSDTSATTKPASASS